MIMEQTGSGVGSERYQRLLRGAPGEISWRAVTEVREGDS